MKLLLASGVAALIAAFQMPAEPPMKMGLWEFTTTTKMNMPDMPHAMANMPGMGARTIKVHSCLTKESYQKAMAQQGQQQKNCAITNQNWTPGKYSFDLTCNDGKMSGHFEWTFDSPTAGHATSHMEMSGRKMTVDGTSTTTFLSNDCGGITPDKPEIIH